MLPVQNLILLLGYSLVQEKLILSSNFSPFPKYFPVHQDSNFHDPLHPPCWLESCFAVLSIPVYLLFCLLFSRESLWHFNIFSFINHMVLLCFYFDWYWLILLNINICELLFDCDCLSDRQFLSAQPAKQKLHFLGWLITTLLGTGNWELNATAKAFCLYDWTTS